MPDQPLDAPSRPGFVPVCAIGASAGGVGVLQTLFRLLPADLGLAYVVVVHLAPDHPSSMHEILAACTRMPVHQVQDGPRLEANHVYVIPPDRELVIDGDDVTARPFTDPRGRRAPIDMFFRSVAAGRGDGIAVVLTGAGADGAVGVRAVKEAGGIIMVQEPAEAGFPSMPQNAIATGVADVVAPVARLAERIAEAARSKEAVRSLDEDGAASDLRRIMAFLRTRTGHDFSGYKRATVLRRVMRRMQVCQITDLDDYARHLRSTPEEAKALFADLLISVTQFFRDAVAFRMLAQEVVRPLLEKAGAEDSEGEVRAWVVGCATGEEAYSLAILLLEEAERLKVQVPAQIFATDLDEGALGTAREGRYPRSIEADVSAERLKRFFVDEGTHYRVNRRVRDLVLFATHSVVREPPFMRLDLVTCRNVLIYLERTLQQHVCAIFHYGLKPGGALFLGTAETADMVPDHFLPVDRDARIYRARGLDAAPVPVLAPSSPLRFDRPPTVGEGRAVPARFEAGQVLGASHAAALEASAPPSALVDAEGTVLHLSASAGRFILLSAGPLSGRLTSIVQPELRLDLGLALDRAFGTAQPTTTRLVDLRLDGALRRISVHVVPQSTGEGAGARAIAFFLDNGPGQTPDAAEALPAPDELRQLHGELKAAQEAVLAGRIGHEAALQELRASNEELQSLNEEYRSTAEELETSKEELQSINEELQTVNAELKSKLSTLSVAHDDLQNLTASSEIGTLILDPDLRIRMFTPRVADLINITAADVGRPVTDFTHRLDYHGIERDMARVLRDLSPIEEEIRGLGDRWFTLRVRPYRTHDNRIEGAVFTFDDITERKRGEIALRESEGRFRALVTAGTFMIYRMSPDWRLMYMLDGHGMLSDTAGADPDWAEKYILEQDRPSVSAAIASAIGTKTLFDLEHRVRRADGGVGWVVSRAVPLLGPDGEIAEWFGVGSDVTERRVAVERLRESEERHRVDLERQVAARTAELKESRDLLQGTMDSSLDMIQVFKAVRDEGGAIVDFTWILNNHTSEQSYGDVIGQSLLAHNPGVIEEGIFDAFKRVVETGVPDQSERRYVHEQFDGWFLQSAVKLDDGVATTTSVITARKRAEQEVLRLRDEMARAKLRESEERFRALAEGIPQLVWRASASGAWTWSSPQWTAYTGQSEEQSRGDGWLAVLHPDDRDRARAAWSEASGDAELAMGARIRQAGTGAYRWFQTRAQPVRDGSGAIVEWLGTSTDVQDLKALQERQEVLVAELQHRTRNLIAVVRGVADDTMDETGPTEAFRGAFFDRLAVLSRVQGLLSRAEAEPITIRALVRLELDALGAGATDDRVVLDGPDVLLKPSTVQTLVLALHELATNARKHGALSRDGGRIAVTWREGDEGGQPRLLLDWIETGVVPEPDGPPSTKAGGYGRELIERALPHALGARTSYVLTPSGVRCSLDIPARSGSAENRT